MKKKDLIIVPFHDYKKWLHEGFRTRDAHLFEHFQNQKEIDKILVINRPVSLLEVLFKHKCWKTNIGSPVFKQKNWQVNKINDKVYLIDFFSLDFFSVMFQRKKWWYSIFEKKEIITQINQALSLLNFKNKILFLENPMAVGVIGKLGEEKFVFDAIDNWLYHPQMSPYKNVIETNYKYIAARADLIYTVSSDLRDYFNSMNDCVYWLPNGVDSDRFKVGFAKEKREFPTFGYIGKIQERLDFELIEKALKKYKNHKFIIIGPIYAQYKVIEQLKLQYENIEFVGDINYADLPESMQSFDIAILPHKVNQFTNSMNPIKVYEYLSAGKQVVSTSVAGIKGVSDYIYVSANHQEFLDNLQVAIDNYNKNDDIQVHVASSLSDSHSWEKKVQKIIEKIEEEI